MMPAFKNLLVSVSVGVLLTLTGGLYVMYVIARIPTEGSPRSHRHDARSKGRAVRAHVLT
jgi:hypothetical protein